MTRKECLEQAAKCVLQNRQDQYGDVEDCFKKIAKLWNAYLPSTIELEPFDVACMMALLKIARIQANPKHGDSWVDLAGYAACGADIAVPEPFRYDKPKTDGDCRQNGNDQPEEPGFKRGDKVQAFNGEEWVDCRYIRWKEPEGRHVVQYKGCMCAIDPENLRPVSRAEGCESLVEKDAPQTKEELYSKILESNPATYGSAHKPMGEELAEMAEEDGNA